MNKSHTLGRLRNYKPNQTQEDFAVEYTRAAVLIALFTNKNKNEEKEELFVWLTERNKSLRSHPGEVCLPGGTKNINCQCTETVF